MMLGFIFYSECWGSLVSNDERFYIIILMLRGLGFQMMRGFIFYSEF